MGISLRKDRLGGGDRKWVVPCYWVYIITVGMEYHGLCSRCWGRKEEEVSEGNE